TAGLASLEENRYPTFTILPHVEVKRREQQVFLRSPALCHWIATASAEGQFTLENPLREGWLETQDLAEVEGRELRLLGRRDEIVKVLGILVSLPEVEAEAIRFFERRDFCICAVSDPRSGRRLVLFTDAADSLRTWDLSEFNKTVDGPRRIHGLCWIPKISRTDLGKVKRA